MKLKVVEPSSSAMRNLQGYLSSEGPERAGTSQFFYENSNQEYSPKQSRNDESLIGDEGANIYDDE